MGGHAGQTDEDNRAGVQGSRPNRKGARTVQNSPSAGAKRILLSRICLKWNDYYNIYQLTETMASAIMHQICERIAFAIVLAEVRYPDRIVGIALLLWSKQ